MAKKEVDDFLDDLDDDEFDEEEVEEEDFEEEEYEEEDEGEEEEEEDPPIVKKKKAKKKAKKKVAKKKATKKKATKKKKAKKKAVQKSDEEETPRGGKKKRRKKKASKRRPRVTSDPLAALTSELHSISEASGQKQQIAEIKAELRNAKQLATKLAKFAGKAQTAAEAQAARVEGLQETLDSLTATTEEEGEE